MAYRCISPRAHHENVISLCTVIWRPSKQLASCFTCVWRSRLAVCLVLTVSQPCVLCATCVSAAYHTGPRGRHDQESVLQRRVSGEQTRSFSWVWTRGIWQNGRRINSRQRNGQWEVSLVSVAKREREPSCFSRSLRKGSFTGWLYNYVKPFHMWESSAWVTNNKLPLNISHE